MNAPRMILVAVAMLFLTGCGDLVGYQFSTTNPNVAAGKAPLMNKEMCEDLRKASYVMNPEWVTKCEAVYLP